MKAIPGESRLALPDSCTPEGADTVRGESETLLVQAQRVSENHRAAIAYHPGYLWYDFGPEHPMRPERVTAGLDLLETAGIWDRDSLSLLPGEAKREELELVHDAAFIRTVKDAGSGWFPRGELVRYGLGPGDTPAFPGMHEAAALVAGGSVEAARQIMRGELRHAFNPAGGLHHALHASASGFCIYNDPAIAAAVALKEFGAKTLYVDFDCHHGDGIQRHFYQEPRVMTVSIHETGRFLFPGTGEVAEVGEGKGHGYAVNVPVAPFTHDESWLEAICAVLPPLIDRFRPDLIISSHGADTHVWDPLTHLSLTTASFVEQARLIHELAHGYCEGRWLALGSGGYEWRRVVSRSWAILWAEMTGQDLPDRLPEAWCARWGADRIERLPFSFLDEPEVSPPIPRRDEVVRLNRETVRAAQILHRLS